MGTEFTFTGALAGNEAAKKYFDSLPESVQETIKQSGMQFESEQALRDMVAHFMQGNWRASNQTPPVIHSRRRFLLFHFSPKNTQKRDDKHSLTSILSSRG